MIDCIIMGDSIAVGTHRAKPECVTYVKGGLNTWQWNRDYLKNNLSAKTVIISLGSNDHKHIKTQKELETLRAKVKADRVFWILPYGNLAASRVPITEIQQIVREIAAEHGDKVISINGIQSDGIHPSWTGYRRIVEQVKTGIK